MSINNLPELIAEAEYFMKTGCSVQTAFPNLRKTGVGSQFAGPAEALKRTLNWVWLQWHSGSDPTSISHTLRGVIERGIEVYQFCEGSVQREQHDFMLLAGAVILRERKLIENALNFVHEADGAKPQHQFFPSITGMLKFRFLGLEQKALEQFEVYSHCKGKETILRVPERNFLEAFIRKDPCALQSACSAASVKFRARYSANALGRYTAEENVPRFDPNRLWQWPECAFLASNNDWNLKTDPIWLPTGLTRLNGLP